MVLYFSGSVFYRLFREGEVLLDEYRTCMKGSVERRCQGLLGLA
jgi:hypothetical protein